MRFQLVSLSLICMSNDSANLLALEDGIEMVGQRAKDMFAGLLSGREIAALAKAQHHVEKAELRIAVGDRVMLAADSADADAAEREDAGFDRGLADDLDDLSHVEACIEIGGIFDGEMRHGRITPR